MSSRHKPRGPYATERAAAAAVEAFHAQAQAGGEDDLRRAQVRLMLDTLAGFGVKTGSFDKLVIAAIGQWEPLTTIVLTGLFERVHAAAAGGA